MGHVEGKLPQAFGDVSNLAENNQRGARCSVHLPLWPFHEVGRGDVLEPGKSNTIKKLILRHTIHRDYSEEKRLIDHSPRWEQAAKEAGGRAGARKEQTPPG